MSPAWRIGIINVTIVVGAAVLWFQGRIDFSTAARVTAISLVVLNILFVAFRREGALEPAANPKERRVNRLFGIAGTIGLLLLLLKYLFGVLR